VQDPDSSVSKTHLRLDYAQGSVWVTDLGSTNGTDLMTDEGATTRLPANVPTAVDEGVRVRMGKRTFTISPLLPSTPSGQPS
jgi:predicted component of type VI protein secretion system